MFPTLEKYHGTKSRHTCPACNSRNCFVRYVGANGEYISFDVGRCNRESKCGYHYKPKQFFADNPTAKNGRGETTKGKKRGLSNYGFADKTDIDKLSDKRLSNTPDFILFEHLKATLSGYDKNNFV